MHLQAIFLAAIASLASVARASPGLEERGGPASTQCYTKLGKGKVAYSTNYQTTYTKCTNTRTSTSTKTLSKSTKTITSKTTVTVTAPEKPSTSTSIVTSTETDTTTSTVTATVAGTSTVPTSDAFLPIQTTLPDSSYSGSGGADPIAKRDVAAADIAARANKKSPVLGNGYYPHGVTCREWEGGKCGTTTKTVTTTSKPTTTVTKTSTVTTTKCPSAVTTTTVTSTSVTTTTSTEVTTSTTASIDPSSPTLYAACASNNLADTVGSSLVGNAVNNNGLDLVTTANTDTAYDCCVLGAQMDTSTIFIFAPSDSPNCYIETALTAGAQSADQYTAILGDDSNGQITVGNLDNGEFSSTS